MTSSMPTKEEIARDIEAEVAAAVKSRADLMDMAYVLESEAADRYAELADQMGGPQQPRGSGSVRQNG